MGQLEDMLAAVGVASGDTVMIHSDSTMAMALSGAATWNEALQFQLDGIQRVLGPTGTLVVPTFTYAFCKGTPYDRERSPSEVGMFSNFVLAQANAIRSSHPIFSVAAIGPRADELCESVSRSAFGKGSIFERLHAIDASLMFMNVTLNSSTFVHYVEEQYGVSYRFLKEFTGEIISDGKTNIETVEFFVRHLDRDVEPYFGRLETQMKERSMLMEISIPEGVISYARCTDVYDQVWIMLDKSPYSLLKRPPY